MALELMEPLVYFPSCLRQGLRGYWKANEPGLDGSPGQVEDSSGNGNHGTAVNGATTTPGKLGNALSLESAHSQCVDCGDGSSLKPDAFTLDAWVKWTSGNYWPVMTWAASSNYPTIRLLSWNGTAMLYMGQFNFRYFLLGSTDLFDGQWHHICATVPGGGILDINDSAFYVDNQALQVDTTNTSGGQTGKERFFIGRGAGTHADGLIDDLGLWGRVLSDEEKALRFNSGRGMEIPADAALPLGLAGSTPELEVVRL